MVPGSWFQMRLAYSRSVAVTSIVGHVVGLGDRHVSNILIDQASGELVHIDLGIAFDQASTFLSLSGLRAATQLRVTGSTAANPRARAVSSHR